MRMEECALQKIPVSAPKTGLVSDVNSLSVQLNVQMVESVWHRTLVNVRMNGVVLFVTNPFVKA